MPELDMGREVVKNQEQIKTLREKQDKQDELLASIYTLSENAAATVVSLEHLQIEVKNLRDDFNKMEGVPIIAIQVEVLQGEVNSLKDKVEELQHKPIKRWDGIVQSAFGAIVGGLIIYLMTRLGLG